jgi:thiol-disulfide isomerase/thioredoxin
MRGPYRRAARAGLLICALATAAAAVGTSSAPALDGRVISSGRPAVAPAARVIPVASRTPAPDFSAPALGPSGVPLGPARFDGDVVVLGFWSSWCAPCRAELRQLQGFWRQRPAGTQVLGVDVEDSRPPASVALRAAGVTFPNVVDATSSVAAAYGIAGTPTVVIIDRAGREAAVAIGPTPAATILGLVRQLTSGG